MKVILMSFLLLISIQFGELKTVNYTPFPEEDIEIITHKYPVNMKRNNPFNIRVGNDWQGEKPGEEQAFEQFIDLDYGLRAGFLLLRNYANNYGLNTIQKIIYRFAPPIENDTENYIRIVCSLTGYEPDQELDLWDKATLLNLAGAMIYVEQGIHLSPLDKAYNRFFNR